MPARSRPNQSSPEDAPSAPRASLSREEASRRTFESPLTGRYGASEMAYLFSPQFRFSTWRRLWLALAEAQKELGLPIRDEQLDEMRAHLDDINYAEAEAKEREVRHDVMAHVHAFGLQAPSAKAILHLGATSMDIVDNAELLQMKQALELLSRKVVNILAALAGFAAAHKDLAALAFTHFQAAQPTTVGKRACLWMQDLLLDLEDLERLRIELPFRGVKGATGTQASFLRLFDGDAAKVRKLEELVAARMGFPKVLPVTGQTYSRKLDARILQALAGLGQSAHKFANDLRLLAHLKEVEEPFEKDQVGSSAMAYKRNPMRAERMTGLARHLLVLALDPALTAAEQWLERTLDDSSNKRLAVPEAFLTADVMLETWLNVSQNLVVYPAMMQAHLREELPFLAIEDLLMEAVKAGGDRQALHERLRRHSQAAAAEVKLYGRPNDLLKRVADDPAFAQLSAHLENLLNPRLYTGLAAEQTQSFLEEHIKPVLDAHKDWLGRRGEVKV